MIRPSRHACTVYGSRLPHSSFILPISLSFLVLYILALAAPTSATIRQTPLRSLTSISPPSGSNNGSPRGRQASVSEYSPSHPRPNGAALTKPRADLRYRSIYQVLTDRFGLGPELGVGPNGEERIVRCDPDERRYCGGTWKGIEMRLEYIQGMGFDTVWISPIVQNIEVPPGAHEPYHGYWAADIYQLNSRFGTMQDLLDLSAAIHARGMYLMVDIVANHLGAYHENPFMASRQYGPFDHEDDFHPKKFPDDWDDQEQVEQRWLGAETPDLNTESPRVIRTLHHWISTLIPHFSIDFIRIDTVKHVRKSFWPDFVHSAGVPAMGEVLHGDPAYLAPYQKEAMASLLDFGNFFHLRRVFGGTTGDVGELVEMMGRLGGLMQTSMLGSFLDNHDFERLAGLVTDNALVKNAAVFPFINDGFPIVYQGQEHGLTGGKDPMNREAVWLHGYRTDTEMYHLFRRLNRARRTALSHPAFLTTPARATRISSHIISIRNSPLLTVLNNLGTRSAPTVAYLPQAQTGYKPLLVVIDVISGQVLGTDQKGGLSVPIVNGEPRVFLPLALHRGQSVSVGEWYKEPMSLDMGNKVGGGGEGSGSPGSPGRHTAKTPSFGRVMSWLGMGSGGKS